MNQEYESGVQSRIMEQEYAAGVCSKIMEQAIVGRGKSMRTDQEVGA